MSLRKKLINLNGGKEAKKRREKERKGEKRREKERIEGACYEISYSRAYSGVVNLYRTDNVNEIRT